MNDPKAADDAVERFYKLLLQATSVRVAAGNSVPTKRKNDNVLFVETGSEALSELRDALRLRPLGAQYAFMTPGDPTLALFADKDVLLTIQYLGADPDAIRSDVLPEDALLADRDALGSWLRKYGGAHQVTARS
jgi:hypothetical protein